MLDPDIGKGRQIKELIIVILKFGEIEKEINAMLATVHFCFFFSIRVSQTASAHCSSHEQLQ